MNPTEFIEWGVVLLAVWFALSFFVGILRTTKRAREAYMAEIRNPAFDITYATKLRRDLDLAIDALCALVEP